MNKRKAKKLFHYVLGVGLSLSFAIELIKNL